jgi:hypothetical protein
MDISYPVAQVEGQQSGVEVVRLTGAIYRVAVIWTRVKAGVDQ